MYDTGLAIGTVLFTFASYIASLFIHELGHVFFLILLDRPPAKIIIGNAEKGCLVKFTVFFTKIFIARGFPVGGRCNFQCKGLSSANNLSKLLIYSGGIIFNFIFAILFWLFAITSMNHNIALFLLIFSFLNISWGIANVFPVSNASDGKKLVNLLPCLFKATPPDIAEAIINDALPPEKIKHSKNIALATLIFALFIYCLVFYFHFRILFNVPTLNSSPG